MVSLALLPCSFTDGARLVGELCVRLRARVYTEELLIGDVAATYGMESADIKKWLYWTAPPKNRLTLEKEKLVNLCKSLIADKLFSDDRVLLYGNHAAMVRAGQPRVRKILIADRLWARVNRAMQEEGWSRRHAQEAIKRLDKKLDDWTRFLFGRGVYAFELYDKVVSFEGRPLENVVEEIVTIQRRAEMVAAGKMERDRDEDVSSAVAVERVLLESGYRADVRVDRGKVKLLVEVSGYHYPWLADKLTELMHSVKGVREVTVERVAW